MVGEIGKKLVLHAIDSGISLPFAQIDRVTELIFLKRLLAQLGIDCVLDVGANRGQFAGELRQIGYKGYIISFEPVAREFTVMTQLFRVDRRWKGLQFALGRENAETIIGVPNLSVMSSLLEPVFDDASLTHEKVAVRRLDGLMADLSRERQFGRCFLKMDTQGYDLEVFAGASGCMDMIHGIQSELSVRPLYKGMPHYLHALQVYEEAGFDLFNLSVVGRVERGDLLEMNCFMRRAGE